MRERELAELRLLDERLRVDDDGAAGGGVARVPDRDEAAQPAQDRFVERAGDQPHLAVAVDAAAVADREPGALLAAVLQRVEPEVSEPRDVFARRVDSGDPARFVQYVTGGLHRFLVVRARHTSGFRNRVRPVPVSRLAAGAEESAAARGRC